VHKKVFSCFNFLIIFSFMFLLFVFLANSQTESESPTTEQVTPSTFRPVDQPAEKTSWFGFLVKGGLTMIPIVLCSVSLIAILAFKFSLFRLLRFRINNFSEALTEDISSGHIDRAAARCEKTNNAITRPLKRGLDVYKSNPSRTADTLREAMLDEIPGLESYVGWLGVIAGISPLLGLYGTVVGVIQAFIALAAGGVVTDPNSFKTLADAIYKALITTAAGLFVGIPAFVAYEYLRMKITDTIRDMDRISISLLNALGIGSGE